MTTRYLASIQSMAEALLIEHQLPDILDMKNPATGALGAMSITEVTEIVRRINGRCLTSATVGDLAMDATVISEALNAMSQSRVDYLKIGLFDDPDLEDCLEALKPQLKQLPQPVIAVLFADQISDASLVPTLAACGFAGVMLDTASKRGQRLTQLWSKTALENFVLQTKQAGMLSGLAGALKFEDITALRPLNADYLGFRSALCDQQQRTAALNPDRLEQLRLALAA
ncbi:hypothetical protein MPL1_03103 [Methylophaga lonarensis MPL]|uniref:(5-formylfuran-3-yl)methyl phosphate synthase n=1 Tax=Methylophaga lonarensis MPL TaxID=1286106 RepID=M7PIU5_9GAMM|nr:(5-formylfuran-3-yl)methyl phosphate synthase [Methylophaga lonarensis]EMR13790.1 hypothetical protein MPL1_03103 [Methylophaga lonarensis MPL]